MGPFDFVNAVSKTKKDLISDDPATEKQYVPFVVNRSLSLFVDCVLYANQLNIYPTLDHKLQFDYLLNTLRPRTRFQKWPKTISDQDVALVEQYYKYSRQKAKVAVRLLTRDQLDIIRTKVKQGGTK